MATCPTCKTREGVTWEHTGRVYFEALPLGSFSLSGNQLKFPARSYPVILLEHPACGWVQECYDKGDGYAYPIPEGDKSHE